MHLNQFLEDVAKVNDYPEIKMYAFAKVHFKGKIPRNKIESIVEPRFRNPKMDHSNIRKQKVTKSKNISLFSRLPKALQQRALEAIAPLTESMYHFTEDDE